MPSFVRKTMATIHDFTELECWKLSRELSKEIFDLYMNIKPFWQDFALKDQIRRSSGSIMDNISEGFGRGNNKEFINYLGYSNGSCTEVRSQLFRALDSAYISSEQQQNLNAKIRFIEIQISSLLHYLNRTTYRGNRYKAEDHFLPYGNSNEIENIEFIFPWT